MTALFNIIEDLREIGGELARLDSLIIENPDYPSLRLDYESLSKRQRGLQEQFNILTNEDHVDVCSYRLIPEDKSRFPIAALANSLREFQAAFTRVFDGLKSKTPKRRGRVSAEITAQSTFDFAYAFSGSLGLVFTMPNERLLIGGSDLDDAMELMFQIFKSDRPERVRELAVKAGIPAIRSIHDWAREHAQYDINVEIKWQRKSEVRASILVQAAELRRLQDVIESTRETDVEDVEISGTLFGLDTDDRTFHMKFPEAEDVEGRLSEDFIYDPEFALERTYIAQLEKSSTVYYAYEREEIHWTLKGLTRLSI